MLSLHCSPQGASKFITPITLLHHCRQMLTQSSHFGLTVELVRVVKVKVLKANKGVQGSRMRHNAVSDQHHHAKHLPLTITIS